MELILIFFWSLCVWATWQYARAGAWHPRNFLTDSFKNFPHKEQKTGDLLERIGRTRFISEPGYVLGYLVDKEKISLKLKITDTPLSLRSYLGLKQLILTFFLVYFWLYIWFGEVSWRNSFWFFVLLGITFHFPDLWLQALREKRLMRLSEEVPYFIDLLSLTLQTGMNIEQALLHTAHHKKGIMAQTIVKKCRALEYGRPIESLLEELKEVLPNPEFDHFLTSILRAKKLGVSLTDTLEIQSKIMRTKRRQNAEELSRTAAVKISLPLVLFIFPALLIIYIGPGLLHLMQN